MEGKHIPGKGLPGTVVSVKDKGKFLVQREDGEIFFPVPSDGFCLDSVNKKGYVLMDYDFIGKQFKLSDETLYIVMETPSQILEDKVMAMQTISNSLQKRFNQKVKELNELREQNRITIELYNEAMQELYSNQGNNQNLIMEMAEQYSKIDYDQLDEFYKKISEYILNGELDKADSLLNNRGDLKSEIAELKRLENANNTEEKEIKIREENLSKSKGVAKFKKDDIAKRCYKKYEIFRLQYQNDSAAFYLKTRADLDTANINWALDLGLYLTAYTNYYNESLLYCNRALNIAKSESNLSLMAKCYNTLGLTYHKMEDYATSYQYHSQAVETGIKATGENHPEVAQWYNNLGSVYISQGQYQQAFASCEKALEILLKSPQKDYIGIGMAYANIGNIYYEMMDYSNAIEYFKKSLESLHNIYGDDYHHIATIYNNLGACYMEQHDYKTAFEYKNKALDINKRVLGEFHPNVASCYSGIGLVHQYQGNNSSAVTYYNKALDILQGIYGKYHRDISTIYGNIGAIEESQGRYNSAIAYYNRALEISLKILGEQHIAIADIYKKIANIFYIQNYYNLAITYYTKALNIYAECLGEKSSSVIDCYFFIGHIYEKQGYYSISLSHTFKILDIVLDTFGENHTYTATCYSTLGILLHKQKDYQPAISYLKKALNIYLQTDGEISSSVRNTYNLIGFAYRDSGDYLSSVEFFEKALEVNKKLMGTNHQDIADGYINISKVYESNGDYISASNCYKKVLEILQNIKEKEGEVNLTKLNKFRANIEYQILILELKAALNGPIGKFKDYISDKIYTATINDSNSPASKQGLSGEYYLLEFNDWSYNKKISIFDKIKESLGVPKTILLYKDGNCESYSFENSIGIKIGLKVIDKEEKKLIDKLYEEWKNKNL